MGREWLMMLRSSRRMMISKKRELLPSVMKPSSGSTLTNLLKLRNSMTSKRKLRLSATQSSPSSTSLQEVPAECLVECQVVCQEECQVQVPDQEVQVLDPPLKKLTKLIIAFDNLTCSVINNCILMQKLASTA